MRVLHFYPWGQFYPITCGSDYVACNQLEYFQHRGWEVHCLLPRGFGRGLADPAEIARRFPCVASMRLVPVHCPRFDLRHVLNAMESMARSPTFRAIAAERFDLFFANYVFSAPLALVQPPGCLKVVEAVDLLVPMFGSVERYVGSPAGSTAMQDAETRFLFRHLEVELFQVFDRAAMISEQDTAALRTAGYPNACYVPQMFPVSPGTPGAFKETPYDIVFVGSENHLNTFGANWFYRHVYVPYLRLHKVRFAVAGRVCENMPFEDSSVAKLGPVADLKAVYDASKLVIVPIFEGTGIAIKLCEALAAGRAVVTTPVGARGLDPNCGAFACVDMRAQPQRTAEVIRELLAHPERRVEVQLRAVALMRERFSRERYFAAMDEVTRTANAIGTSAAA
jgi:glycosyltransferase involved in cell wall biosynthesis